MTRSDPRSDFLSAGKAPLAPPPPPLFLSVSVQPSKPSRGFPSDEDECNAVQRDVNSFPAQDVWSSDNGPFPFTRYSAAISDPNCIRETRRSNHRYWLVSEDRVNCTSDVNLTGGIIAATLISPATLRRLPHCSTHRLVVSPRRDEIKVNESLWTTV